MSFGIFVLVARHLFFFFFSQPFCVSLLGALRCAAFKQAARFDVLSLLVVPPQVFFVFFSSLSCLASSGTFRGRVFPLSSIANTSRKYGSVNASPLTGDLFRIDGVQPSLKSPDLLPLRSREANKRLFVGTRCKASWPPHSRRAQTVQPHLQELIPGGHC